MKTIKTRSSRRAKRFLTPMIIIIAAGLLMTTAVYAVTDFQGEGTILFDKIKSGTLVTTGTTNFTGALLNSNPVHRAIYTLYPNSQKPLKSEELSLSS